MYRPVRTGLGAAALVLALLGTACGSDSGSKTPAAAIAGIEKGIFADKLGPNVDFKPSIFNAGGAATEALFSGAIDATFIGPSPSINAFVKSKREAIRIIAGATSGGAALVV